MKLIAQLQTFEELLGVRFNDPMLFQRALTHRSYLNEHSREKAQDNERLEFLGDSILDFIAAEWLYARFPEMNEGNLTRLRAGLVRNNTLATYASALGIGEMLLMGKGEQDNGGRSRTRNLGGAFEAIAGALYLDQGLDAVRTFATPCFVPVLDEMQQSRSETDAKSRLQEWSQATLGATPTYRTVESSGPDHAREFTLEVLLGDRVYGSGHGSSKQEAAQAAAQAALNAIKEESL